MYLQSQWSSQELDYLRLIATEILESERKEVSSTGALRLTDQVVKKAGKKLSMEAAEKTISSLISNMWLKQTKGKLVLGVRFIGEMESWMVEVMGRDNIQHCQACRKVVVRGGSCPCQPAVAWHFYCLEKSARLNADIKCGVCQRKVTVGARAKPSQDEEENDDDDEEEEEEEASRRPRKKAGRRGRRSQEEEDETELEVEEASQRSRKQAGRRGRRSQEEEEDISPQPGPSRGEPSKRSRRRRSGMEIEEEEEPSQAGRSLIRRRPSGDSDDSD